MVHEKGKGTEITQGDVVEKLPVVAAIGLRQGFFLDASGLGNAVAEGSNFKRANHPNAFSNTLNPEAPLVNLIILEAFDEATGERLPEYED